MAEVMLNIAQTLILISIVFGILRLILGATTVDRVIAIDLLTKAGYEAHAITGKVDSFDWLESLGARQCVSRHDLHWGQAPLEKASWAGCIDTVGGGMLSGISRVIRPWGNIAVCGMAGGHALNTTVFPLILRGVSLLGVSSANCDIETRRMLWNRLGGDWKPAQLDRIVHHLLLEIVNATQDDPCRSRPLLELVGEARPHPDQRGRDLIAARAQGGRERHQHRDLLVAGAPVVQCYVVDRDLHSVPARRSSDLDIGLAIGAELRVGQA